MTTPIRPSLSQMLNPQAAATARPAVPSVQGPQTQGGGFTSALAAQKAFFQQAQPKITPATYTAADIARAAPQPASQPAATVKDETQPLKRPGSYLNIVI